MIKDSKGTRKISAKQAIAKRLVQKAMAGDISAVKLLQTESPNFLRKVVEEVGKSTLAEYVRHLVETMSHDAMMEYRSANISWGKKISGR